MTMGARVRGSEGSREEPDAGEAPRTLVPSHPRTQAPSLPHLALYFAKLGATGFGGPIALAARMQKTLVDEREWYSKQDFLDGLALAQLSPGPLAAQLAMYLGAINRGVFGATVIGAAFILPSLLMVWAAAFAYVRFGGMPWIGAAFYGVGAAVIAIIVRSAWKLAKSTLTSDLLLWSIALSMAVVTVITGREIVWIFFAAGLLPLARKYVAQTLLSVSPRTLLSVPLLEILWFFTKAGAFVFGSGLAIVPFLYGEVVQGRHWLTDRQFLDAVAVAMITPGPVVISVAFIGYLVARVPGMTAAAIGVFVPAYLVVIATAHRFRAIARKESVRAFVSGVTAAATGAMTGAAIILGRRAIIDIPTTVIALATFAILSRTKISDLWLIAASAIVGVLLR
jgi:chromate transporter